MLYGFRGATATTAIGNVQDFLIHALFDQVLSIVWVINSFVIVLGGPGLKVAKF